MDNQTFTTKQLSILHYIYRFRFLTSTHIQHLLNDKTLRLTNYHLKILTEQNYINKHYTRSLGNSNQPAVYFLASGSIKALQDSEHLTAQSIKRIYREKTRSQQFIEHALFIAKYYIFLTKESQKTKHTLHFFTKTDLQVHPYVLHPLPDAYFARVDEKQETKRYFVEIVDDGTPRFALRKRIEQYNDYIEGGRFEEVTTHSFPTILFICPSVGSLIYLKKHLSRIYDETLFDQTEVYVATREDVFVGKWEKIESDEE